MLNYKHSIETYTILVQRIWPFLTIFMPVANEARVNTIISTDSAMQCLHVDHFNDGALVPAPLPPPDPVQQGSKLKGGAIAGIVVGSVVGALIIAGLCFWLWRRRRTRAQRVLTGGDAIDGSPATKEMMEDDRYKGSFEAPMDAEVMELGGSAVRPELPSQKSGPRIELPVDDEHAARKQSLVELEGDDARKPSDSTGFSGH
jgi:hypothetical protein